MASKTTSSFIISLLLTLVVSMLIHSPPCLGGYLPDPSTQLSSSGEVESKSLDQNLIDNPQFFGGFSPFQPCLAAVANTGGCVAEIYKFRTGQATKFRDVCCKSMLGINDSCWATVLPYQPFFPAMMKSYCTGLVGAVLPTPP
ncbi:hypothetical protein LIER_21313 [Lithospermum erythrorhizon]|uniref:Prolamin-like domain-containing protein n=1 Tax=Lithospermum erythrorhizon TaxID=34254 RepID=A0AAV3QS78_LITER